MRWIASAALLLVVPGCGAEAERASAPTPRASSSQELPVRAAVEGYYAALRGDDVAGVCLLVAADGPYKRCVNDVRRDLRTWSDPVFEQRPKVTSVVVRGDRAQAKLAADVAGQPSPPVELVREEGRWKILRASMPGSAGPREYSECVVAGLDGMVEEKAWREFGPVAINEFTRRYCAQRIKEPNLSDRRHEEIAQAIILDMCREGRLAPHLANSRLT